MSPPGDTTRGGASGGDFVDAKIEDRRDDDEEAKEDDLKDEAFNHNMLTIAYRGHCLPSHDAGACRSQLSALLDCCVLETYRQTALGNSECLHKRMSW